MAKHVTVFKTPTITLSEGQTKGDAGFWLWDATREMNLAMRAGSEREAFSQALEYYQNRLREVESSLNSLQRKVDKFVEQFVEEGD